MAKFMWIDSKTEINIDKIVAFEKEYYDEYLVHLEGNVKIRIYNYQYEKIKNILEGKIDYEPTEE